MLYNVSPNVKLTYESPSLFTCNSDNEFPKLCAINNGIREAMFYDIKGYVTIHIFPKAGKAEELEE